MENKLTQGKVYHSLIRFAAPFLLAHLLQVFYGATDLFVVGQFATTADVSAVAIGSQVMNLFTYAVIGVTTGATVLLGRYFGSNKPKELAKTVGSAIVLFSFLAVILTILLSLCRDQIVFIMSTPEEAVPGTQAYLGICFLGVAFIVGYNVVSGILRGLGDSKTPLLFVAIACAINVVMDFLLVCGFHMGAKGAAMATVGAQGVSFFFALFFLKRRGLGFRFGWRDIGFHPVQIRLILKNGLPLALQDALVSASFLLITIIVNHMGLVASAAVGVVEKLIGFLMLPSIAMSAAVAAMVAQNVGAGQYPRAKKCMWGGVAFSLAFAVVICLFCQFWGATLTGLFTSETSVKLAAADYLRSYSIDCVMVAFVFSFNGYFNGCGRSIFSMAHSLTTTFLFRIPLSLLFSKVSFTSLYLMGVAAPFSTFVSLILCLIYLRWLNRTGIYKTSSPSEH